MDDAKWEFIHSQILASSIMASLQRAHVYVPQVTGDQREQLRRQMKTALREIGGRYGKAVPGTRHERHIGELSRRVSERCAAALVNRHLRFGIAAKALNLYLKYLWCLGRIPAPPHCPFDRQVIGHLPPDAQVAWTRIDDLRSYQALVEAARACARGENLAEWELRIYQGA